jgi:hypothetical protein
VEILTIAVLNATAISLSAAIATMTAIAMITMKKMMIFSEQPEPLGPCIHCGVELYRDCEGKIRADQLCVEGGHEGVDREDEPENNSEADNVFRTGYEDWEIDPDMGDQ